MIPASEDPPNPEGYLLIDTKKCQGCMSCMLACSLVHEGEENLSLSRIQVVQNSFEKYPHDIAVEPTQDCDLCNNTPFWYEQTGPDGKLACVAVCPVGAVRFSKEVPSRGAEGKYNINLRGIVWRKIGYPID
jgi:protein NrfC